MKFLQKRRLWAAVALVATVMAGAVYVTAQQSLRHAANQPQTAMARDVVRDLAEGKNPKDLVQGYIDMPRNLAPFIIVYDQYGKVVEGNGYLDNKIPQVPIGVLSAASGNHINSVTWQPRSDVRIAAVSVRGGGYYVLGGRSLADTESQIRRVGIGLLGLWVATLILLAVGYTLARPRRARHFSNTPAV